MWTLWWGWMFACSFPALPAGRGSRAYPCTPRTPTASSEVIALSNIAQLVEVGTLCDPRAPGLITSLHAVSATTLLAGQRGNDALVWDLPTGVGLPLPGSGEIVGVSSGVDGTLFTGSTRGVVEAREPAPPHAVRWTARPSWGPTWAIAPLPGGDVVVGSNTGAIARIDSTGAVVASASGWRMIWGVTTGSDGDLLVSEQLGGLHHVRADTLEDRGSVLFGDGLAWQADANAEGDIAIASDGHAVIIDKTGRHLVAQGRGTVRQVAWSPDGKWLASGGDGGLVQIWAVEAL